MDLSNASLQNADLSGVNLSRANLRGANLKRTDLKDAILEKTIFAQNIGISEHQKQEWVKRGALFEISE